MASFIFEGSSLNHYLMNDSSVAQLTGSSPIAKFGRFKSEAKIYVPEQNISKESIKLFN